MENKNQVSTDTSSHGIHYQAKPRTVLVWMVLGFFALMLITAVICNLYYGYQYDLARAKEGEQVVLSLNEPFMVIGLGLLIYGIIAAYTAMSYHNGKIEIKENTSKFGKGLFLVYISTWNVIIPLVMGFAISLADYLEWTISIILNIH